jgi:hypothetical protein
MVSKKLLFAATAVVAAGLAGSSQAATVLSTGDVVDGWMISFPVGIALVDDGGGSLTLEKAAAFDSLEGLSITFNQVSASASSTITITDESITNVSGVPFGGFQFLVLNELPGNAAAATLQPNAFTGGTSPFTTQTDSPSTITLGGGTLANNATAKWGFDSTGGDLAINANPAATGQFKVFDLKEIPLPAAIPIPAAAWTGLSGLLGLAVIGNAKRLRKLLA